ncbi:MAG: pyruvate, water dikinase regulatory protein [Planctomycetota bacterium]
MKKTMNVFIISDATATTAESVLNSVLVQYKGVHFNIERFRFIKTVGQIDKILSEARHENCIVIFTFVSGKLRDRLITVGRKKKLVLVDVMGPLIKTFTRRLRHSPKMKAGAYRKQSADMFRLTEAIEYAMLHDDGQGEATVDQADLIIFGVSRTGKTPASMYLSCKNLKVANFPVVEGNPLPRAFVTAPGKKVGFLIDLDRLVQLRSERMRYLTYSQSRGYASRRAVFHELEYCRKVFRKIPLLHTIDITNRSIEETSEWITHNVL